jgi:hypothetical protein
MRSKESDINMGNERFIIAKKNTLEGVVGAPADPNCP